MSRLVPPGETSIIPTGESQTVSRTLTVEGELTVEGTLTVMIPTSSETDSRAMAKDILESNTDWPDSEPIIEYNEDVSHKSKENTQDAAIYIMKRDSDELERFSADFGDLTEDETVTMMIWVLGDSQTNSQRLARQYRNEVVNVFRAYMNDNYTNIEFHRAEPSNTTDHRQEHITRQTDHYIYGVEVDTHRLLEEEL